MPKIRNPFGFTLIELMVAISIIAVMATVGMVVYSQAQKAGRISKRVQDLAALHAALELFKATNGSYPSVPAFGGFTCIGNLTGTNALAPNYITVIPKDPIQSGNTNCYGYLSDVADPPGTAVPTAKEYKVRSLVPDTEMSFTDINQQPTLINPANDGNPGTCAVEPLTETVANQGWAYYTTGACAYAGGNR
jgi:prepilin-type N-terminal cleavage/methylation domain-containing protein